VWTNPVVECVLSPLNLTKDEQDGVRHALERMVRERAAGGAAATLTNPVNIAIGTK
jgi:hypothetical protein